METRQNIFSSLFNLKLKFKSHKEAFNRSRNEDLIRNFILVVLVCSFVSNTLFLIKNKTGLWLSLINYGLNLVQLALFVCTSTCKTLSKHCFNAGVLSSIQVIQVSLLNISNYLIESEQAAIYALFYCSFAAIGVSTIFKSKLVSLLNEVLTVIEISVFFAETTSLAIYVAMTVSSLIKILIAYQAEYQVKLKVATKQTEKSLRGNLLKIAKTAIVECSADFKDIYLNDTAKQIKSIFKGTKAESIQSLVNSLFSPGAQNTDFSKTEISLVDNWEDNFTKLNLNRTVIREKINFKGENLTVSLIPDAVEEKIIMLIQQKNKKKSKTNDIVRIITGLAHDIKNNLVSVSNTLSCLKDTVNFEYLEEDVKIADFLLEMSFALLNDIKSLDQSREASLPVNLNQKVDLVELTEFIKAMFKAKMSLSSKEIEICSQLNVSHNIVRTDETRLKQILINLVSNSYKFTDLGSICLNIREEGNQLKFSVSDTGCGMSPTEVAALNKAFVKSSEERNSLGWGLGMNVVSQLITLIKGEKLEVNSQEQKGTTVSFILPYNKAFPKKSNKTVNIVNNKLPTKNSISKRKNYSDKTFKIPGSFGKNYVEDTSPIPDENDWNKTTLFREGFYFPRSVSSKGMTQIIIDDRKSLDLDGNRSRLIVVDDNKSALESAKRILEQQTGNLDILLVTDGIECLHLLKELHFNVNAVLSDLNMDFMNGDLLEETISIISAKKKKIIQFVYFSCDAPQGARRVDKPLTAKAAKQLIQILEIDS